MKCQHEIWEMESEAADGACPVCLALMVVKLQNALHEIDALATAHKAGAIGKAQKIARKALSPE